MEKGENHPLPDHLFQPATIMGCEEMFQHPARRVQRQRWFITPHTISSSHPTPSRDKRNNGCCQRVVEAPVETVQLVRGEASQRRQVANHNGVCASWGVVLDGLARVRWIAILLVFVEDRDRQVHESVCENRGYVMPVLTRKLSSVC